jgi:hypothetical protein
MNVEDAPRITISDLRGLPTWPDVKQSKRAVITLELDGAAVAVSLRFDHDETPFGKRAWFRCPVCGARRRHLHVVDSKLGCRGCHKLLYYEQSLGRCRWKNDIAIPALRAAGNLQDAHMGQNAVGTV